jgi:hypothetical protein
MGTSCAVTFTTICDLLIEHLIRQKSGHRLAYSKRFIDDIVGVWLVEVSSLVDPEQDPKWLAFQEELNISNRFRWTFSTL